MSQVLQLKIVLRNIDPPLWRRVEVVDNITFYELHYVIQISMGWWNEHLFEFKADGYRIGLVEPDEDSMKIVDARELTLSTLLHKNNQQFFYLYDFGDCWEHDIIIEKIHPKEAGKTYPICSAGQRECPPENVGGYPGYQNFLSIISDPNHEQYSEMKAWAGEDIDPEYFNAEETNAELQFIIKTKNWNPN